MREYKFRGKRIDNNKWVTGNYLLRHDSFGALHLIEVQDREDFEINRCQVYSESVGQYIGWQDKDKKDVYEGDLIEIYWANGDITCEIISYSEEYGYFMYGNNPICELKDPTWPIKIIGNIFENAAGASAGTHHMTDPREGQPEGQEEATETQPETPPAQGQAEG